MRADERKLPHLLIQLARSDADVGIRVEEAVGME
jgi:hypothetical protein